MQAVRLIFPMIAAGALAVIAHFILKWLLSLAFGSHKALSDFNTTDTAEKQRVEARMGSKPYIIRLAFSGYGIDVSGWEETALYTAYGVVTLGLLLPIALVGFPPLIWLAAPGLAYVIVNGLVSSKWTKVRQAMEKEIPLLLTRLSGGLQASSNVLSALSEEAEDLQPGGPLQAWVQRLVRKMQADGMNGLKEMQDEAKDISSALLLFAVQVERLYETGGQGYVQAFQQTAQNLSGLLETRAEAMAVADGAWGTVRIIALALGGAVASVMLNPASQAIADNPIVQIATLIAIVWAGIGWWYIGNTINEATQ